MTLFEPPPHQPTIITPKGVMQRAVFDVALGMVLGGGAACLIFGWKWAGFSPVTARGDTSSWPLLLVLALVLLDAVIIHNKSALERRSARAATLLRYYHWPRVAGFALLLGGFAFVLSVRLQTLSEHFSRDFLTLTVVASLIGGVWLVGYSSIWREARARAAPWVVAAISLYMAADWALALGPTVDQFADPRADIARLSLIGCGVFVMCAVLAIMDWRIMRQNRISGASNG